MKTDFRYLFITGLILLLLCTDVSGNVRLPSLFSDNMVLQQNSNVAVWGWADPGEIVNVLGDWNHKTVTTRADEKGHWLLHLKTTKAGGPYHLIIKGNNTIELNDVLLGEVWYAQGNPIWNTIWISRMAQRPAHLMQKKK